MQNVKNQIRTRRQGDTPFFANMLNNGAVEVCLKDDVNRVLAEKDKAIADAVKIIKEQEQEIAEKNQRIKELTPQWVRLSDRLPTTAGPHLVIFQNGRGGCLPFNVEAKSFQVAGTVQWWADGTDIFGDWTGDK